MQLSFFFFLLRHYEHRNLRGRIYLHRRNAILRNSFVVPDMDTGLTLTHAIEWRLLCSAYPAMAIHAAKNVKCHTNIKQTANPATTKRLL